MKKFIEIIKKKWLRDTSKTILLVAILVAVFIGINILIQKADLQDIDVTQNKLYSLSEESKSQTKNVSEEVTIRLIGFGTDSSIENLAKQYTKNNENIKVDVILDIEDRPDLKSKYGITSGTQVIIVETATANKIITTDDLYSYDYTTYEEIDLSEQKLTNAIVGLTLKEIPKIYFLTGHNEYGLQTHLTILNAYLENEVNDVATLDLLVNQPEETPSLIVIGTPTKDFADVEVEYLTQYINNGGKILWMNDPQFKQEEFPNMKKILDLFGGYFDDGIILEQDSSKMILQTPNFIIPTINYTNATKDIATDGGIMLINAGKISIAEDSVLEGLNVNVESIVTSSENALYRTDLENSSETKISSDEEGQFIIAAKFSKAVEEDKEAVLYMIADNLFATDYAVTAGNSQTYAIYFYNNKDYILNTIADLTQREDTISIRKDVGTVTYTATEQEDTIIRIIIFALPAVIILVGIIVWQVRRHRTGGKTKRKKQKLLQEKNEQEQNDKKDN